MTLYKFVVNIVVVLLIDVSFFLCRSSKKYTQYSKYMNNVRVQKYLAVATKTIDFESRQALQNHVFGISWQFGIVDMNLLMYNGNLSWSLVTYFPYDNDDCSIFTYKTIATYTLSNYTQLAHKPLSELYAIKMENLRKCPINIAVFQSEPYIFTRTVNGQTKFDGIEIRILELIASSLNFTPNFLMPPTNDEKFNFGDTKDKCYKMVI